MCILIRVSRNYLTSTKRQYLNFFTDDSYVDAGEMRTILKENIRTLNNMQDCLIVVSLGLSIVYDSLFSELFSRTISSQDSYGTLSVNVDDNGKKNIAVSQTRRTGNNSAALGDILGKTVPSFRHALHQEKSGCKSFRM